MDWYVDLPQTVWASIGLNLHIEETHTLPLHPIAHRVITKLIPKHIFQKVSHGAI